MLNHQTILTAMKNYTTLHTGLLTIIQYQYIILIYLFVYKKEKVWLSPVTI